MAPFGIAVLTFGITVFYLGVYTAQRYFIPFTEESDYRKVVAKYYKLKPNQFKFGFDDSRNAYYIVQGNETKFLVFSDKKPYKIVSEFRD